MKAVIPFMFCFILLGVGAFAQTVAPKPPADNTKGHQTLYFRGFGPCDLTKELTQKEREELTNCIINDTSVTQIRHDFDHPGKELAPLVKKLSEESKTCILETAKFSEGPKSCSKPEGPKK
jgi:hypothetical protein